MKRDRTTHDASLPLPGETPIASTHSPSGSPPRISIVTPSFNQGLYLEAAMRSVLDQNYPNLEYIVIDGGSTDGSVDIIRKYADRLAYWCSEPDNGQYAAINKGFARSTGEIMAWLNADDLYFTWAFRAVSEVFTGFPDVSWISSLLPVIWNIAGVPTAAMPRDGYNKRFFFSGYYSPWQPGRYTSGAIQQESTFWRRSLWDAAGGCVDTTYSLAGDFELWARFMKLAPLTGVMTLLGGFRYHGLQRSIQGGDDYERQADAALATHGGKHFGRLHNLICALDLPRHWPLRILPSLGFIQPVQNVRWSLAQKRWILCDEFAT